MEWGDIVIEGSFPDCTLLMRRDQSVAESGGSIEEDKLLAMAGGGRMAGWEVA